MYDAVYYCISTREHEVLGVYKLLCCCFCCCWIRRFVDTFKTQKSAMASGLMRNKISVLFLHVFVLCNICHNCPDATCDTCECSPRVSVYIKAASPRSLRWKSKATAQKEAFLIIQKLGFPLNSRFANAARFKRSGMPPTMSFQLSKGPFQMYFPIIVECPFCPRKDAFKQKVSLVQIQKMVFP